MEVECRSRQAVGGREVVEKPEAITEYKKYMGGVDRGDQFLSYYGFPHHTIKWWKREFFLLFDAAIMYSYIMYSTKQSGQKLSHEVFLHPACEGALTTGNHHVIYPQPFISWSSAPTPATTCLSPRTSLSWTVQEVRQWPRDQRCCAVCSNKKGEERKPLPSTANSATCQCV